MFHVKHLTPARPDARQNVPRETSRLSPRKGAFSLEATCLTWRAFQDMIATVFETLSTHRYWQVGAEGERESRQGPPKSPVQRGRSLMRKQVSLRGR